MIPNSFSQACVTIIKAFEGLHRKGPDGRVYAYRDPVGIWTIGYGSTHGVHSGMVITEEEAEKLLIEDIKNHEKPVRDLVKIPLTQAQYDALVSFVFNIGGPAFKRSTLLRKLNAGDYDGAAAEFARWNKAGGKVLRGLTRRRAAEATLFTYDAPIGQDGEELPKHAESDGEKSLVKSRTLWGVGVATAAQVVSETAVQVQQFAPYHEYIQWTFIGISLVGVAIAAYARFDDHRTARR